MCAVLACARSGELFPSSIRSSTSCRRLALDSAGEPETSDPRCTEAQRRSKRFRLTNQVFLDRERSSKPALRAHVRNARAFRPPCLTHRRTVARSQRGAATNRKPTCALARLLSQAASLLSARPSDRAAHASRPPEGLGPASFGAPRRAAEFGDTRGAFHRLTTCFDQAGLTPSAACG